MRASSPHTERHSLRISVGTDSAPSWPSWTFLGPLPRSRGPRRRSGALPERTAAHPLSDQRTLVSGWRLQPGRPDLFTRPGQGGGLMTQPWRTDQAWASLTAAARARSQTDKAGAEPVAAVAATSGAGPQLPGACARSGALWEAPPRCCGRNAGGWRGAVVEER